MTPEEEELRKQRLREYHKSWRQDNEEYKKKRREYMKEYRSKPGMKEKISEMSKEYRLSNPEKFAEANRRYRENHKEELEAKRKENKEQIYKYTYNYIKNKRERENALFDEVESLRVLLKRATPEYEYPEVPKRDLSDRESCRAYEKAIREKRKLKVKYYTEELEILKEMKEKAGL